MAARKNNGNKTYELSFVEEAGGIVVFDAALSNNFTLSMTMGEEEWAALGYPHHITAAINVGKAARTTVKRAKPKAKRVSVKRNTTRKTGREKKSAPNNDSGAASSFDDIASFIPSVAPKRVTAKRSVAKRSTAKRSTAKRTTTRRTSPALRSRRVS